MLELSPTDEIVSVVLPNRIDDTGRKAIQAYCQSTCRIQLPEDWDWSWIVGRHIKYVGTLTKRISKFAHETGIKLTPDQLTTIGNIGSEFAPNKTPLHFKFTDILDWPPGAYGDDGSCFWDDFAGARPLMEERGGHAIQIFNRPTANWRNHQHGIGRAWLMPMPKKQYWVVFNAYGPSDLLMVARTIAHHLGLSYKRVNTTNNGVGNGLIYINGRRGVAIGPTETLQDCAVDLGIPTDD